VNATRYGLYLAAQDSRDRDSALFLEEILEQVRFARDSGFDSVLVGQHFLSSPFQMFQPTPLLGRIAAESGALRIGAGVFLAALLNPVELAENAATLDIISGGRLILAAGLGYRSEENRAFAVTKGRGDVLAQKLDVVRQLLEGEPVTAAGLGYEIDGAEISVRPLQSPRPPIWLGAVAEVAIRRAARIADTWFLNPIADVEELRSGLDAFADERGAPPLEVPAFRETCVAETDAEANAIAREHLDAKYQAYADWGMIENWSWDKAPTRFFVGSPDTVVAQIREYEEWLGVTDLLFRVQWPGFPHARAMQTLHLLTNEVMPRLHRTRPPLPGRIAASKTGATREDAR
jgi:alkanesulfonate monooxygenase SsuD/methylene tetrahydromethanopterin reductase-like flavin-dependent oxidoreductase (luciferase family)